MLSRKGFDLWADKYDESVDLFDVEGSYPFAGYKKILNEIYNSIINKSYKNILDIGFGFRVIIMIKVNSYVNIRSSRLLPKFKIQKINSWCAA